MTADISHSYSAVAPYLVVVWLIILLPVLLLPVAEWLFARRRAVTPPMPVWVVAPPSSTCPPACRSAVNTVTGELIDLSAVELAVLRSRASTDALTVTVDRMRAVTGLPAVDRVWDRLFAEAWTDLETNWGGAPRVPR